MKVRTSLFLLSAIFVILIVALGFVMFHTSDLVNREVRHGDAATRIIKDVFELNIVTYEYMTHHEERMHQQWLLRYDSLGTLLERMREEEMRPEHLSRLESITSGYESLGDLFSQLQANFAKRERLIEDNEPQVEIDLSFALEQRLSAQALIGSQRMASQAFDFSAVMQQRVAWVQQRTNWIALFSIIGFAILSFYVSFLTTRAITGPLDKLVKGAEIIGKGNLKHRVDIKTRNEIGELAAAFDQMTEKRQRAEEALREYSERLEEMVEERTKELQASEERYRTLHEGVPVGLYRTTPEGQILDANPALVEMLGYPDRDSLAAVKAADLYVDPQERAHWQEVIEREGVVRDIEMQARRRDGTVIWVRDSARAARDGEGRVLYYEGSLEDITERKKMQEQLVRREKLAVLGQLAGGVGHELRNPLGAIKNAAYFLNMAVEEPDPEVKETLEILEKEVGTSERIISSLLDFARPKPPTRRKVDINQVVEEAVSRASIPDSVEVVSRLDEALPTTLADPDQLAQVFGNIILNAIQAMPQGGQLTVKSEAPREGWVSISLTDTGVGIPQENLGRLFEPLFTTKAKGIGLGLAVVKTLVEGHGGTIEADSEEGKGSTFTVRLPVGGKEKE